MRRIPEVRAVAAALALALAAVAERAASAPPDPALMARLVEAAGGRDAVDALPGFRARGKVLPLIEGPTASVRVVVDLGGSLREDVRDPVGMSTRRMAGPLTWSGHGRPKPVGGEEAKAIRQRFRELVAPFEPARTSPDSLNAEGKTAEGWERLTRRDPDGSRLAWDVDPETGHVRRFATWTPDSTAAPSTEIEFDDYREVDGVAWPFRATTWIGGRAAQETAWERFEAADDLSPDEFLPPAAARGL